MLIEKHMELNSLLESISDKLDISPSKYQQAVDRYTAVGKWLDADNSLLKPHQPRIFPQGSFRLGTVTRPWREGKDAEFDIDLVCNLAIEKKKILPIELKKIVGDRLKANQTYQMMLDDEGRRCWTLEYEESDGVGFHMDVLPAIPEDNETISLLECRGPEAAIHAEKSIGITNTEDKKNYSWLSSNPEGYALWFDGRCRVMPNYPEFQKNAKLSVFNSHRVYASVDSVPDQLVRTPLQRAVQILKRHRDVYFAGQANEHCMPISMIITTLAASCYDGESDVFSALTNIVSGIREHAGFVKNKAFMIANARIANKRLIYRDRVDGTWYINNPVNPEENFADRWHEKDDARAKAFFQWVDAVSSHFSESSFSRSHSRNTFSDVLLYGVIPVASSDISVLTTPPVQIPHVSITNPNKPWGCKR